MSFVYERIAQVLAANEVLRMSIEAGEIRIAESSYPVTVRLLQGGRVLGSASGMQAGDYVRGVPFDGYEVVNGANPQTVVIKLASGQSGSDRITGEVSVISGEIARVSAGMAYMTSSGQAAVVAQNSFIQLWNPAGSGKKLVVNQLIVACPGGAVWWLRWHNAAAGLATGILPGNKLFGGGSGVAEARAGAFAGALGQHMSGIYGSAKSEIFPIAEPLVIRPGMGLLVQNSGVNELIHAAFQFWEESV